MIASEEIWKSLEKLEMLDTYENIANYVKTVWDQIGRQARKCIITDIV